MFFRKILRKLNIATNTNESSNRGIKNQSDPLMRSSGDQVFSPASTPQKSTNSGATLNVPISSRYSSEKDVKDTLIKIRSLGNFPEFSAVKNLINVLQFDVSGEVAIHASLALAFMQNQDVIEELIMNEYRRAPRCCAAGYPPKEGDEVFPLIRLLYPLAWRENDIAMKVMIDANPQMFPTQATGKAAYELVTAVPKGPKAVADKICWLEYLDEAGNRELMDLTITWYPLGVEDLWSNVGKS